LVGRDCDMYKNMVKVVVLERRGTACDLIQACRKMIWMAIQRKTAPLLVDLDASGIWDITMMVCKLNI
jgi:hypothetical protein